MDVNRLSLERRAQALSCLCEGMSLRATSRVTGIARETLNNLLLDAGKACADYMDAAFRNLRPERIEADEQWAFVGSKDKNVPEGREDDPNYGSVWNWVALDSDSKLVITWLVGDRGIDCCYDFLTDLRARLVPGHRFQLTTDGYGSYPPVVDSLWRDGIDYAQIIKEYGGGNEDHKYSPGECTSIKKVRVTGDPDEAYMSTSYIERQNLTTRMHNRRFTRLTNAFSKRVEQHAASVALNFAYYNLCLPHATLTKKAGTKTTPAMAAGIERAPWSITQLAELLESN